MKIRLDISYDGSPFIGWQKQSSELPTIQGTLERALERVFEQKVKTLGSGRTDAGVHAFHQVVHFTAPKSLNNINLHRALNSLTPPEIVIDRVYEAPEEFHAIASAESKTYKYLILNRENPSPFRHKYTTWVRHPLDLPQLNELSKVLVGERDFKSFQTAGTPVKSTVREISQATWTKEKGDLVIFTISGSGFLKQMVRNIVGTLLELSRQNAPKAQLEQILANRDRRSALSTAPPQGLYLYRVTYPSALDKKCRKI